MSAALLRGGSWREAVLASGGDRYVRDHVAPWAVRSVWSTPDWWAVAHGPSSYFEDGALLVGAAPGRPADALLAEPDVLRDLCRRLQPAELTVPYELAGRPHLATVGDGWAWLATTRPPADVPGTSAVTYDPDPDAVAALLDDANPDAFVRPGHPWVLGWAGVPGTDGRLLACGAWTRHAPGVPHLAAVTVAEPARGRGLGSALTVAVTRMLLRRHHAVSLAAWGGNETALRLYRRIGFGTEHRLRTVPVPRAWR